ncbi:MAG TPA: helix-turn-helix transcriptional regulator [Candidatus Acidoferrum sp.]|jgi:DNA-binding CsgD family transcriptional regulator|nr:helix-turn-helix transcriptional regulator [Candidatus Acidoferrum sp.]
MELALRTPAGPDFGRCIPLLSSPFLCDRSEGDSLCALWSEIVSSQSGVAAVAADANDPAAIVHFAFGVFVSDERIAEYRRCTSPCIARSLLAQWVAGKQPFLSLHEIASSNAGQGLNLLMTHYGHRRGDTRVYAADYESSRRVLRGWNLRTYTVEMFTEPERDDRAWGRDLGFRVLEYPPSRYLAAGIPMERAPFLWAASREEAKSDAHYGLALLFETYAPPRFALTLREQQVLGLALDGGTDASVARIANISESTVKKIFRSIYAKVARAGIVDLCADDAADQRGAETRRHLLNYVREHPQELRPYSRRGTR